MVKVISIQRIAERGVVQFIKDGKGSAIEFSSALSDKEVLLLLPNDEIDIEKLRAQAKELNIEGFEKMNPKTLQKKIDKIKGDQIK